MLSELYIENFAIIQKVTVHFSNGLSVITGETGSGKSILLDAIEVLLGARASKDQVGEACDRAIVEGVFNINDKNVLILLDELGIDLENNRFIITREIRKNEASITRINSRQVTLETVKKISATIIDTHSQNSSIFLTNKEVYLDILDRYEWAKSKQLLHNLRLLFEKKNDILEQLKAVDMSEEERMKELSFLRFQDEEISFANLTDINESELDDEFKRLTHASEILEELSSIRFMMTSNETGQDGLEDGLSGIEQSLQKIAVYNSGLEPLLEEAKNINFQFTELRRSIERVAQTIDNDPERLQILNDQLLMLHNLKRKYGSSIDQILEYQQTIIEKIDFLENLDEKTKKLENEQKEIDHSILEVSQELSKLRKATASTIQEKIIKELQDLNFSYAEFKIVFQEKKPSANGLDTIDFLISFNKGQPLKSMSMVASGGELSRLMLAFKAVLSVTQKIETLIFDEIDTGLSGRTALVMGQKLLVLSRAHQVIAITHLPQLAALAKHHYIIRKEESDEIMVSSIKKIANEDRIEELARIIGGINITENTRTSAREMLAQGIEYRRELSL